MSQKRGDVGNIPCVDTEADLDFIAGFPCDRFGCLGTLQRADHRGHRAIVCSRCEAVLYRFVPES